MSIPSTSTPSPGPERAEPVAPSSSVEGNAAPLGEERWSTPRKLLFRVALLYFALHVFPYPLPRFAAFASFTQALYSTTTPIVNAIGVRYFGLPEQRRLVSGCGDRADHYVGVLIELGLALALAGLWGWVGRRRPQHARLAYWGSVAVRYYVGYTMLEYGIIKILKSQFPFPGPPLLLTPLGELDPMRVLWVLMGVSVPYTLFIGACEFVGGCLLFFRRTLVAGALLTFGVLLNVFLMNLFYGVCVKLLSAHLLLMTGVLLVPDGRRLVDAVLLGRAVPARRAARPVLNQRLVRALSAAKLVVVPGLLLHAIHYGYDAWHSYGDAAPKPPLYGIWDVESFSRDGQVLAADSPAASRWLWLAVDVEGRARLRRGAGRPIPVRLGVDAGARRIELAFAPEKDNPVGLSYSEPEPDVLELRGELDGSPTVIRLKQRPTAQLPLAAHRWRWTSDL